MVNSSLNPMVERALAKADRAALSDTALHRASLKAAKKISESDSLTTPTGWLKGSENQIAALIYQTMRDEREL